MNPKQLTASLFPILVVLVAGGLMQLACAATSSIIPSTSVPSLVSQATGQPVTDVATPPENMLTSTDEPAPDEKSALTPTAMAAIETLPAPSPEPVQDLPVGISFNYRPVTLGTALEIQADQRTISIEVGRVFQGKDAEQIALSPAPEEMQWIVIQLKVKYLDGTKDERVQLFEPDWFHIVTKGHVDASQPFLTFVPSPGVDEIRLIPGEQSLGYLAFQVYKDDPAPLLRIDLGGKENFFSLTGAWTPAVEPDAEVVLVGQSGNGTVEQPVPVSTSAYVTFDGVVYQVRVEKILRGFDAFKKIHDGWGINEEPPQGQEYIMPYVSVRVARALEPQTLFYSGAFYSYSNQEIITQPENFFCPLPCFQSAYLYPGGTVSGWVPLLAAVDDPAPLMVFNQQVYFQLVDPAQQAAGVMPKLSANAISYANRDRIQLSIRFGQVGPVNTLAFSHDDRLLLTGGDDKLIHVWEIATGQEIATLKGHKGRIKDLTFSADGKWLASTGAGSEVIVWDTTSWQAIQFLPFKGTGIGVKFRAEGTLYNINQAGVIQVWDTANWQPLRQERVPAHMSPSCADAVVHSFDASWDGSILAASLSCGYGIIWQAGKTDLLFGTVNRQNELPSKVPPVSSAISLSADGKEAAYGMVYYPTRFLRLMDIIDVSGQQIVASVSPMDPDLYTVEVAPGRDIIFAGVGNVVYYWWPEAFVWGGENIHQLDGHSGRVTSLEISNNGEILASGDYNGSTILWIAK